LIIPQFSGYATGIDRLNRLNLMHHSLCKSSVYLASFLDALTLLRGELLTL